MSEAHGLIGARVRRREDAPLVMGKGRYVEDVHVPDTLYLGIARSPYPHARIRGVSTGQAKAVPGVVAVVTAEDLGELGPMPMNMRVKGMVVPAHPPLAADVVHAVGVPVAAVVAEQRAIAEDAAALVEVEYEPLPGVADAEAALGPEAPRAREDLESNLSYTVEQSGGDVDGAFREADRVVSVEIHNPRLASVTMEPRAILAVPEPTGDGLTVWLATQSPFRLRADLARVLGLPEHRLHLIAPDVGGSFGTKNSVYREDVLACLFALRLRRPVKWVASRTEDFLTMQQGRDVSTRTEMALSADGMMLGLRVNGVANLGAYFQSGTAGPPTRLLAMSSGCYRVPNVAVEVRAAVTNTVATGAYRGAGRPESVLLIERTVDRAARELGMDPVLLRRKNFIRRDEFPFQTATGTSYDSGNYEGALDRALELAGYDALIRERDAGRARGELMGVGLATFVEPSGGGFESGLVRVERSGKITAVTGSSAHGQGHETAFAQVVADRLGVRWEDVAVLHGDTRGAPQGVGTYGSRSAVVGGSALVHAADRVIAKARRMAAHLLEASPDDVLLKDGAFVLAGAEDRRIIWADLAAAAYRTTDLPEGEEPGLEATAFFQPELETFAFGTHVAVVRIDRDTGVVCLEKLVCVDDCGTMLNPLIVEGQVVGGIAQGLGQAFLEQVVFEDDGTLVTASLGDYAVPRASDMPASEKVVLDHTVTPSPRNPLGVKGVGESGTIGAPAAVANAVVDALAPLGVTHVDMPFTSQKIWQLVRGHSAQAERP